MRDLENDWTRGLSLLTLETRGGRLAGLMLCAAGILSACGSVEGEAVDGELNEPSEPATPVASEPAEEFTMDGPVDPVEILAAMQSEGGQKEPAALPEGTTVAPIQLVHGETLRSWPGGEAGAATSPAVIGSTLFFCADSKLKAVRLFEKDGAVEVIEGVDACLEIAAYDHEHLAIAQPGGLSRLKVTPALGEPIEPLAEGTSLEPTDSFVLSSRSGGGVFLGEPAQGLYLLEAGELQLISDFPSDRQSLQHLGGARWAMGSGLSRRPLSLKECDGECSYGILAELSDDGVMDMATSWGPQLYVALSSGGIAVVDSGDGDLMKAFLLPDGEKAIGLAHSQGRCSNNLFVTTDTGMVFWQDLFKAKL